MTAVRPGDAEAALRRLDPAKTPLLLVYGPDTGLVAERARMAARGAVQDPDDPFQLVRLEGDLVAGDPGRLADEAGTVGLFGGRRSVWVRPTARNLGASVEAVLGMPLSDVLVVIEAGDLAKTSPLRTLCERSPLALAVPCYADEGRGLEGVVDETMRQAGLRIGADARRLLLEHLGGDRLATRSELGKLVLYAEGRGEVTAEDIEACLSDVSSGAHDAATDAAFAGDPAGADEALRRLAAEGGHAPVLLAGALRHALALLGARAAMERGEAADGVLRGMRLHFRREPQVRRHLALWTTASLRETVGRLDADLLRIRQFAEAADTITSRALLEVATRARQAQRRTG